MGGELDLVSSSRALTSPEFHRLANVPPEAQWFANLDSAQTRRAYQNDIQSFMASRVRQLMDPNRHKLQ